MVGWETVLTNKKLWWPTRGDCLINDGNKSKDAFLWWVDVEGVYAFAASFMDARPGKFLPYSIHSYTFLSALDSTRDNNT